MREWLVVAFVAVGCAGTTTSGDPGASGGCANEGGARSSGGAAVGGRPTAGAGGSSAEVGVLRDHLDDPTYPDSFWQSATYEVSGIDAARIDGALARIASERWEIHSLLIARRGRLVVERYGWSQGANPEHPGTPHQVLPSEPHALWSTTKSFLSALLGIALNEALIPGLGEHAADWFPDYETLNPSPEKSSITLQDLLTMRSGLEFVEPDPTIVDAPDPARAMLSRPVVDTPVGQVWNYSSGNSEILAEILRQASGRTPLDYASEKLFTPLGIQDVRWDAAETGTQHGGFGLWLTSRDMARFGELYRNSGRWLGTQVVPAAWTDESTRARCATKWGGEYAYHWWVPATQGLPGFIHTLGAWGQVIYVNRALELVVVFTAELPNETANSNFQTLLRDYIVPALH